MVLYDGGIQVVRPSTGLVLTSGSGIDTTNAFSLYNDNTAPLLEDVQYSQSADVMWITHPNNPPHKLKRIAANSFVFEVYDYSATYPSDTNLVKRIAFRDANTTAVTLTPGATTGTGITVTCSDVTQVFVAGQYFKITKADNSTTGAVKVVTGGTGSFTADVINTLPSTAPTPIWEESAWSSLRGWPRAACFYQLRLIYANNFAQPDTMWGSLLENFDHLMAARFMQDVSTDVSGLKYFGSVANEDAFTLTLASQKVNGINWLSAGKSLIAGALSAEHIIFGSDPNQVLGALNKDNYTQTSYGSTAAQPIPINNSLIFVQRGGKVIQEFTFDNFAQSYEGEDISTMAEHMIRKVSDQRAPIPALYGSLRIKEIHWQQRSFGILWCLDSNGGMFACTRNRKTGVSAWHSHLLGGTFIPVGPGTPEPPLVRSLAVVPNAIGLGDDIIIAVTRTINSQFVTTLEVISKEWEAPAYVAGGEIPVYSDSSLIVGDGTDQTVFSGLDHLEGETVSILADGNVVAQQAVTAGAITLAAVAKYCVVGLPMVALIKPLRPEAGSVLGSAQGGVKRADKLLVRFFRTMAATFGNDEMESADTLDVIDFSDPTAPMGSPIAPFTGDKYQDMPSKYDQDGYIFIQNKDPVPMNIVCIVDRGVLSEV